MVINDEVIVGGVMAAIIGFVGWIIKVAAREMLDGFKEAMKAHAKSIDLLTKEVGEVRVEMAEFRSRLASIEKRIE